MALAETSSFPNSRSVEFAEVFVKLSVKLIFSALKFFAESSAVLLVFVSTIFCAVVSEFEERFAVFAKFFAVSTFSVSFEEFKDEQSVEFST